MEEKRTPKIECIEDGPFAVRGLNKFEVKGEEISPKPTMMLCRCGQSTNKPYCDGTHSKVGFSGAKQEDRRKDQLAHFEGKQISVHDNRGLCAHAGVCTTKLESVFQFMKESEPRIDADAALVDEIIDVVGKCPSGAISYTRNGKGPEAHQGDPIIRVVPNGPYVVQGEIEVVNADSPQGISTRSRTLCRCGDSKNKPYCDGSHWNSDFDKL